MGKSAAKPKKRASGKAQASYETRLPDPTRIGERSFSKSSHTRRRILDAAVDCLAEFGYTGTTTTTVAHRAGMTRAAMLYHFPSRMALIEAVIHHVTRERIRIYHEAIDEIAQQKDNFYYKAVDIAWEQLQTKVFNAFCELSTAARTDLDLAAVFHPALIEFDRARREAALVLFPDDVKNNPVFDLRRDIVRFLLEGFAQQNCLSFNAERRRAEILSFLKVLTTEPEGQRLMEKARKAVAEEIGRSKGARDSGDILKP